jgi:hypothetical protein
METRREGTRRRNRWERRNDNEEGVVEMEEERRRGGEKRTADQRSPNTEEERINRPRLDESENGVRFEKISRKMEDEVKKIVGGLRAINGGEDKEIIRYVIQGLNTMVRAVVDTMNEVGDAVAEERKAKEEDKRDMDERMRKMEVEVAEERKAKEEDKRDMDERIKKMEVEGAEERKAKEEDKRVMEERLRKMEEKVKNNEVRAEADRNEREMERRKESVREMEDKLKVAGRQIKLLDMDFGRVMTNRKEMVDRVMDNFKEDVKLKDRKRMDSLMRRTRVIVLGKETVAVTVRGKKVYTVPVLLECRNEEDKGELYEILREAEYFGTYHWPMEMMDFVKTVRENVRRMGYNEDRQYIRIRPEERDGRIQLRADVKDKNGGRFWVVATWGIPPLDKQLRGQNDLVARWQRPEGRR